MSAKRDTEQGFQGLENSQSGPEGVLDSEVIEFMDPKRIGGLGVLGQF